MWRRVTREWLAARRAVAELHDSTVVDLHEALGAARRLEQAERRRSQVALELQALHDRAYDCGQLPIPARSDSPRLGIWHDDWSQS